MVPRMAEQSQRLAELIPDALLELADEGDLPMALTHLALSCAAQVGEREGRRSAATW